MMNHRLERLLVVVALLGSVAGVSRADVLDVDFGTLDAPASAGASPNRVQAGFESFVSGVEVTFGSFDRAILYPPMASETYAAATLTIHDNLTVMGNGIVFDDAGTVAGPLGPLLDDYLFPTYSDMYFELSGLAAGTYWMTSYHHNPMAAAVGMFAGITVDTGSGPQSVATDVPISIGFAPESISTATFEFTADGVNDVVVIFQNGSSQATINGFTLSLVPEPSGAILLALGAGAVACALLRRRHAA